MSLKKVTDMAATNFAEQHGNAAFDPTIIVVIADVVASLVEMFMGYCELDPQSALKQMKDPSWLARIRLRWQLRRELGWRGFRKYGRDIEKALLRTGKQLDVQDVEDLYEELG